MPISISGLASGMDTDGIIEKLVNIKKEPIKRLERRKKLHNWKIKALNKLSEQLSDLDKAARDLYGFRASYSNTTVKSSNESVVIAKGTKLANLGTKEIKVIQIAKSHRIASDAIDGKERLKKGSFKIEVNGESYKIRFRGGRLKSLQERIDEIASSIISTSRIKTNGNNHIMIIQSKITGKKGEIKLTGDIPFLKSIGLISGERGAQKDKVAVVFDKRYFTSYIGDKKIKKQDGSLKIGKDGKSVSLKGLLWQEYIMPTESKIKSNSILEFNFSYKEAKTSKDLQLPYRLEFGPKEEVTIKGIKLHGYNVSRIRELELIKKKKKFDAVLGIGVVSYEKGKRTEKIYKVDEKAKGLQEIPIGKDFSNKKINRIIFYCNLGSTDFSKTAITTPQKAKGLLEPKNVVSQPQDAKLNIDGIEITRNKNNNLKDIIPGLSITIKRKSNLPVELDIVPDLEAAVEKIDKFVKAYNEYISFHRELINFTKAAKPGDYRSKSYKKGLFVGDLIMMRLEGGIKRTVNGAYRTQAENPVRMLPEIGISTGKITGGDFAKSWESIKEGKLVVEKELLEKVMRENPEGIRMFFGSDSDGDNRIDTGMAYSLVMYLRPYITGRSIIKSRVELENQTIKMADKSIERHNLHIANYESRLRRKFAKMEQSLSRTKSQQQWMQNQMGTGQNDKK